MNTLSLEASSLRLPVSTADHLRERFQKLIEALNNENAGDICEQAKSLLETIFRTIITNRNGHVDEGLRGHPSLVNLFEQAWQTLSSREDQGIDEKYFAFFKEAVKFIGFIRNNYGSSSHGRDGYDDRNIELTEASFIARLSLSMSGYLYERHLETSEDTENERLNYEDNTDFNDYLDSEGELDVSGITLLRSEVLFSTDLTAYRELLIEFKQAYDEEEQA